MSNTEKEHSIISQNMRAKEESKYLGVGLSTIWVWAKQNKITAHKLSDRVTIFKRDEVTS